jgi:hypothetical protein
MMHEGISIEQSHSGRPLIGMAMSGGFIIVMHEAMQVPLQQVWPAGQTVPPQVHLPAVHFSPAAVLHAVPQVPQL